MLGYLPYWTYNSYTNLEYSLLTTIAYFSASVTATGAISNFHHWPASSLVNTAHLHGVRVVLTATLFNSSDLTTLLSNSDYRNNCITNLLNAVQQAGADGVNIDFEGVPSSQRENLVTFMSELKTAFLSVLPEAHISMATPAVDWSNAWDYQALANICDALFIMGYAYHWGGSSNTGPVAPLTGWGTYNVTWTVNDYLEKTNNNAARIILGVPYYGYEWPCVSTEPGAATTGSGNSITYSQAEPKAEYYGKLWDSSSQTPWYHFQSGQLYQGWYDDSTSLALKYNLVLNKNLQGAGIWALGYDIGRTELWGALQDAFGGQIPPQQPSGLIIVNSGPGAARIQLKPANDVNTYEIFYSLDCSNWDSLTTIDTNYVEIQNLPSGEIVYFKIRAWNQVGNSPFSEVGATFIGEGNNQVLVVNGFDRIQGTNNTFDFVKFHGPAIYTSGYGFDFTSNEAIINGDLIINDYPIVDWILGEEGTATSSFTPAEQEIVEEYLQLGGALFVSGSEIGYDLMGSSSTSADQEFYQQFLKADYIVDRVNTHSVIPSQNSIYSQLPAFDFDDGSHGTYDVDYPDGIKPLNGAFRILDYTPADYPTQGCAGIAYSGTFGNSSRNAALIYLAFPFETIVEDSIRNLLMASSLNFLSSHGSLSINKTPDVLPSQITITNFPNPANPGTLFKIQFNTTIQSELTLRIYNLRGQLIYQKRLFPSSSYIEFYWNGRDRYQRQCPSGIYLFSIQNNGITNTHKFSILR